MAVPGAPVQLLPADTRLGAVHLRVTDESRARRFWTDLVGLAELGHDDGTIRLGAGARELVVLHAGAGAPVTRHRTGLYHLAIHFPSRREFARALARLADRNCPNAPTDHLATETTYLWDPDGHGIEFTFETPDRGRLIVMPNGWYGAERPDGTLHSGREPLDVASVLSELSPADGLDAPVPEGAKIGHVHLHVSDLEAAHTFYADIIGFRPLMYLPAIQMADADLDGQVPHSLALNTWAGRGAPPPPLDAARLDHFTIEVPEASALDEVARRLSAAGRTHIRRGDHLSFVDPAGNEAVVVQATA